MTFSPLHRMLGIQPSPLDFALVEAVVEAGVQEQDDLDWKRTIPAREQNSEFAKDVAAMANSGGGYIVYGVGEAAGNSSAAESIHPVLNWGDADERRLRQVAYTQIQPPVHGLTFSAVGKDGDVVVLLSVPPSLDTPHLVWAKDKFAAPLRYGAQTEYMKERDIENAYRGRFAAQAATAAVAERRTTRIVHRANTANRAWLVTVGTPTSPRPAYLDRIDRNLVRKVVEDMANRPDPFFVEKYRHESRLHVGLNPRPTYDGWRVSQEGSDSTEIADFNNDGSVVFARVLEPARDIPDPTHFHPMDVQAGAVKPLRLVQQYARALGVVGPYKIRTDLVSDLIGPFIIREQDRHGLFWRNPYEHEGIDEFHPLHTVVNPGDADPELLRTAYGLVTAIYNQSGLDGPSEGYLAPLSRDLL